jgi:uncharacterized protein
MISAGSPAPVPSRAGGYPAERHASINDVPIAEAGRQFRWDRSGPRPQDHPGLSDLGL